MARIGVVGNVTTEHLPELTTEDHELFEVNSRLDVMARTVADRALVDIDYLDAAVRAEREGADAVFLNTFADYNLAEMKSAVDVPVVGAGEGTMHMTSMLGERFAIVTVWPRSMRHIYRDRLRACRIEDRCETIVHASPEKELDRVGTDDGVMQRMERGETPIVDRLAAACEEALAESDADTIVTGCTCMAPVAPDLDERSDAPVVDCSRTGLLATETFLRLGYAPSELAYETPPRADSDRITELLDAAKSELADEALRTDAGCPVCSIPVEDE
jgi:allantoin racemase